ncbi:adenylate kinase family enzyme [Nonomuraea thailandensis]|uniref:Adenylate kinase family enzyme n=1 Tax=Nonomuraea thailandensis TaxID=1188745 RepID=A0A9X2JZH0_9ACTN|nr:topology modulation protein [Nonomuraea thailandensis]MCP2354189.1 adenylate kinase family enzyme [Nonomuraea thailandensis]
MTWPAGRSPRRIAVLGCGGSGKTVLANRLGAALGIPVTHLDALYYDDTWTPLPQEEFARRQRSLVARESWIADGNYASTLPIRLAAADTVIFLDLPALTCLRGIATRRWRHRGGQHAETGVYDRITWDFITYICRYRKTMAPRVRALLAEHVTAPTNVIVLRSRKAVDQWHAALPHKPNPPHTEQAPFP